MISLRIRWSASMANPPSWVEIRMYQWGWTRARMSSLRTTTMMMMMMCVSCVCVNGSPLNGVLARIAYRSIRYTFVLHLRRLFAFLHDEFRRWRRRRRRRRKSSLRPRHAEKIEKTAETFFVLTAQQQAAWTHFHAVVPPIVVFTIVVFLHH